MKVSHGLPLILGASCAFAQSAAEKELYPEWSASMDSQGFAWEPHTVTSSDGYHLTMFRITGYTDPSTDQSHTIDLNDRSPLLFKHGMNMDALSWVGFPFPQENWGLQLARQGYDVWYANDRGTRYSRGHEQEATMTLEEYWDFNAAVMGQNDIPVQVQKVLDVTGKSKLTYVGYSQGTAQMFYALSKDQDFYADKIERYVAFAPCIIPSLWVDEYEKMVAQMLKMRELQIYNIGGSDESTATVEKVCGVVDPFCEEIDEDSAAASIGSYLYYFQLAFAQRFQEPISLDDWARGQTLSTQVDLSAIDRVPVSMIVGIGETTCPTEHSMAIFHEMATAEKYLLFEHGDHFNGFFVTGPRMSRFEQVIERGYTSASTVSCSCFVSFCAAFVLSVLF